MCVKYFLEENLIWPSQWAYEIVTSARSSAGLAATSLARIADLRSLNLSDAPRQISSELTSQIIFGERLAHG